MFDKHTHCKYCKSEMEAKYRNKIFCSPKCRVYFNRELFRAKPDLPIIQVAQYPKDEISAVPFDVGELLKQIESIRKETIPPERNKNSFTKKVWENDQKKRVEDILSKIK